MITGKVAQLRLVGLESGELWTNDRDLTLKRLPSRVDTPRTGNISSRKSLWGVLGAVSERPLTVAFLSPAWPPDAAANGIGRMSIASRQACGG